MLYNEVTYMAFRFRRSVKLGKGIRLNVSKRGIGMSVGKRGLRQTFHSTGSSTRTIGIPGTGLSYVNRKRISPKGKSKGSYSTNSVKEAQEENAAVVEEYHHYVDAITHLHLHQPTTRNWKEIKQLDPPFEQGQIGPLEAEARAQYNEYRPNIFEKIMKPLKDKKTNQLEEKIQVAHEKDVSNYNEWEYVHQLSKNILLGKPEAYEQVLTENKSLDETRKRGMLIRVLDSKTIELDIQVSPDEVVPSRTVSLTKTGKVSRRKMGKTNYYAIMKDFVASYVLSVAREVFAILPIESVLIHVNENALNTATGHRKRKVLLSVLVDRQTLNHLNVKHIIPSDALENFEHQMNHLKTKGFRGVKRVKIE